MARAAGAGVDKPSTAFYLVATALECADGVALAVAFLLASVLRIIKFRLFVLV